jgi:hypothetical protein
MSTAIDGVRFHPLEVAPPTPSREPPEPVAGAGERSVSSFERLLRGLGNEIEQGERAVRMAQRASANLDAAELIALQAGIYRYSEAIDLAAKLVDRATSGVRTILQGGH